MLPRHRTRILIIVLLCLVGYQLFTSSSSSSQRIVPSNLHDIIEDSLAEPIRQPPQRHKRPVPGQRLENPPDEIIPEAEPNGDQLEEELIKDTSKGINNEGLKNSNEDHIKPPIKDTPAKDKPIKDEADGKIITPDEKPLQPEDKQVSPDSGPSKPVGKQGVSNEQPLKPIDFADVKFKIKDFTIFFDKMEDYAINQPSIKNKYKTVKAAEKFATHKDHLFSKEYLENVLDIPEETYNALKDSHHRYVHNRIPQLIDEYGIKTFGNILPTDPEWESYQGSSGYVIVGGGQYSWLSYLVIKQLRKTGAKLPIELFIPTKSDFEADFCEKVLPKLNARCNVFDPVLSSQLKRRFSLGGFQYKMLALLSSKFENVLYLDSDNFPTKNVDYLFTSKLFADHRLMLWPDAWARTTNPKYYEIAEIKVPENKLRYSNYDKENAPDKNNLPPLSSYTFKNSWFHDFENTLPDPTSETGMLLINKSTHLKTLLLCLYYNVYGPHFYYPLFTQGSAGEGDKETFIAAAHAMKQPWYQTKKPFKWTGYVSQLDNKFTSKALGHYDPIQAEEISIAKDQGKDVEEEDKVDIIFMHLSYPKFYPDWLANNHDLIYEKSEDHIRMYGQIKENVGYDFDLRVLQFFTEGLCENYYDENGKPVDGEAGVSKKENYMGDKLLYLLKDQQVNEERCRDIFIPHLKWLKETAGKSR
ncbi:uncharacterized protein J8A68_004504 [[Candida] subhashii]|uniref:Alpha-1,2-mannosyltransferase n=1 Tax=[Candida] subhashii TaxID=561895 RepID=A0A8J5QH69_9ASCO|nr:uncharacterized protein J8A68_004504 [[Candida] subhashii]KAG7662004.1 hypothetical protein J8A68_004504 [[Candida] subhashii]